MTVSTTTITGVTPSRSIRAGRWLRRLIGWVAGIYGTLLLAYLGLRLALGDSLWWLALLHNFAPYYFLPLLMLLPVLWLLRMRRMVIRLLPLLLVGLGWFGPRWLPKVAASDADAKPALKIVTFNIQLGVTEFDSIAAWLRTTDADLILLQELGPEHSAQIFSLLKDKYPETVDLVGTTQSELSRLPIRSSERIDLGGWYADRLVIDVGGDPLAVYNIHMPVPYREGDEHIPGTVDQHNLLTVALSYDETWRNRVIHNLLARVADEPLPYVIAGDFNTSDNTVIYGDLADLMHDSFREMGRGLATTWPADLSHVPPLLRLDYVWHSDELHVLTAEIGPRLGSDHLPLVVTLAKQ